MVMEEINGEYAQPPVRNPQVVLEGIRDFQSWMGNAVPGAMDVDCLVERRGHFLVLEGKPRKGDRIEISKGQHIALSALAKLDPFTVYIVGEPSGRATKFAVADLSELQTPDYTMGKGPFGFYVTKRPWRLLSREELRELARAWWVDSSA